MKTASVLVAAASFSAGITAVMCWKDTSGGAGGGQHLGSAQSAATAAAVAGQRESGAGNTPQSSASAGGDAGGTLSRGSGAEGPAPTMDEVFNATGLDRMLLMARFIQNATSAELEEAVGRCARDRIFEPTFADQLWLRWVEVDRAGALKYEPREGVWWALAKLDPDDALREATKAGAAALSSVLFSIAQGNPERARQLLAEHPEVDPRRVQSGMLEGLAGTDPPAAMAMALKQDGGFAEQRFKDWLNRDRGQALAWMKTLTDPAQRRRLEDAAVSQLAETDPQAALEEVRGLPAGVRQFTRSMEAIGALARKDPEAAKAAAEAMPNPAAKQRALAEVAGNLVSTNPEAAMDMLSHFNWQELRQLKQSDWSYTGPKGGSSGYSGGNPASETIRSFMTAAPEATANALISLSPEVGAPVVEAMKMWAGQQPEAASAWLSKQPDGSGKDTAIQGLNQWLMYENPEPDYASALAWAGAASGEMRDNLIQNTLQQWKSRDPAAAAAAVATLSVPEERKTELRKQLGIENQ